VERRRECLVYSNHSGLEAARTSMAANKSEEERREDGIRAVKAKVVVQTELIVMLQTREPDIIIITKKGERKGNSAIYRDNISNSRVWQERNRVRRGGYRSPRG
jgi:hypothetical protein